LGIGLLVPLKTEGIISAALSRLGILVGRNPRAALYLPWAIIFRSDGALICWTHEHQRFFADGNSAGTGDSPGVRLRSLRRDKADFVSKFILGGGDKSRLRKEVTAIVAHPDGTRRNN
jgi:hypothetical protein